MMGITSQICVLLITLLHFTISQMISDPITDPLPEFSNVLSNVSSPVERDVTFTCNVKNIGKYKVGWVKADTKAIQAIGNQIITHNSGVSVSGDFETTFNLHIKEVTVDDAGLYMCQINTDPMRAQSAWLRVKIPPDIDMERTSGDITSREHEDTARLSCHANGEPRPKIVWRREGGGKIRVRTSHHQHRTVEVWTGDTLEILRVRREDMGAYLCIASNDVPPAVSARIYLHVQFSPSILPGLSVLGSAPGSPLNLECIVEAYPKPIIIWSFGDQILHDDDQGYSITELPLTQYRISSKLTLRNYHKNQAGMYSCHARNSLGNAESSTRVYTTEIVEPMIPRREPKYEIILEEKKEVKVIKEVQKGVTPIDNHEVDDISDGKKTTLMVTRTKSPEKVKRKRFGLLSSGANNICFSSLVLLFSATLLFKSYC